MGKIRRVLRCYNCGEVLQSKQPKLPGFVPEELLSNYKGDEKVLYCQECFEKMKVVNTGALQLGIDEAINKILDDAVATDAFIVWVVDLFAFNGTLNPEIIKKVKQLKVAIVATHRDLFSSLVKDETFIRYIDERFSEVGLKPYSITLLGGSDEIDMKSLISKFNVARAAHDVYIIGSASSGKSLLVNKLLKGYENKTKWPIKTEPYPGTNVKVMTIPMSNSSFIYELPSLSSVTNVANKVEKDVQRIITPRKKIETHYRTLAKDDAVAIGSLAYFELIKGKATNVRIYISEGAEIKKLPMEKLSDYLAENNKKRSIRPVSDQFTSFRDFDLFEYTMENDGKWHDISIEGLGWMSFIAHGQVIRVCVPNGSALKESLAKIR